MPKHLKIRACITCINAEDQNPENHIYISENQNMINILNVGFRGNFEPQTQVGLHINFGVNFGCYISHVLCLKCPKFKEIHV